MKTSEQADRRWMRMALRLARRAFGETSPNPMVGSVLVKGDRLIGRGWHHRAGQPHAEIEALRDASRNGKTAKGATLYVTLEPCCTAGRTPPCTDAIIKAGVRRVVVAAMDPNPRHSGRGFELLKAAGIQTQHGVLGAEAARLNEAFNRWIVHRLPFVTVKAAMTLDGKIATAAGESKWITGAAARAHAMVLRQAHDAVLVGVNTVLLDDPALVVRDRHDRPTGKRLRRIVLDSSARTPLDAQVVRDDRAELTTIVVTRSAPAIRVAALSKRVQVWTAPARRGAISLRWVLRRLAREEVTSVLVEGGGEVNASFFEQKLVQRVAFFYAPKVLTSASARKGVGGAGAAGWESVTRLADVEWRTFGEDLFMTARVEGS